MTKPAKYHHELVAMILDGLRNDPAGSEITGVEIDRLDDDATGANWNARHVPQEISIGAKRAWVNAYAAVRNRYDLFAD